MIVTEEAAILRRLDLDASGPVLRNNRGRVYRPNGGRLVGVVFEVPRRLPQVEWGEVRVWMRSVILGLVALWPSGILAQADGFTTARFDPALCAETRWSVTAGCQALRYLPPCSLWSMRADGLGWDVIPPGSWFDEAYAEQRTGVEDALRCLNARSCTWNCDPR